MEFEFKFVRPPDDEIDLSKSNKELFEQYLQEDEKAIALFDTWCEEEQLYTHPRLCFYWQMFVTGIDIKRTIALLRSDLENRGIEL